MFSDQCQFRVGEECCGRPDGRKTHHGGNAPARVPLPALAVLADDLRFGERAWARRLSPLRKVHPAPPRPLLRHRRRDEVRRDRVALPGGLDVEDAVDAELPHVLAEVAVALEVGLTDGVDIDAANTAGRIAAGHTLREVLDLHLEPLLERLAQHLRDGGHLALALRPEDRDLEFLAAESARGEEPPVLLAVVVELLRQLHIIEAVLRDEVKPPLLEPAQRLEAVAGFAASKRGLGQTLEAEPVAEVLDDLLHDVEDRQRRDGVRQVRLQHRQIEAPDVEADQELGRLKPGGDFRREVGFEVRVVAVLLIAVDAKDRHPEQFRLAPLDFVEVPLGFEIEDEFLSHDLVHSSANRK